MLFLTRGLWGFLYTLLALNAYANDSQNAYSAQAYEPITIGVLGDSLSAAYGLKATDGWVHLLSQKLQQTGIDANVINAAVSGATTDAGLHMQPGLMAQQPHIVIIALGANDGLQGKPLGLIADNLSVLITRAQEAGAHVLLLGVHLPPNLGKRYTQPFFEQYATLAQRFNTALVPFFLEGVAGNTQLMQDDGLHPTAQAQPRILDNVWPPLHVLVQAVYANTHAME